VAAEDVQLLRDAYAKPTLHEFGECLHPNAILHQAPEIPDADTYQGKAEFLRGLRRWLEEWDEFRYVPVEVLEGRDRIFMRIKLVGRGKGSGVEIEQEIFNVWEMRDGLAWRCEVYWKEAEARQSAGL
jgi:ketosteroid isomerase-like protein